MNHTGHQEPQIPFYWIQWGGAEQNCQAKWDTQGQQPSSSWSQTFSARAWLTQPSCTPGRVHCRCSQREPLFSGTPSKCPIPFSRLYPPVCVLIQGVVAQVCSPIDLRLNSHVSPETKSKLVSFSGFSFLRDNDTFQGVVVRKKWKYTWHVPDV